jgi:DNA-directed RNA polymerase specialized sigma24 family protein
MSESKVKSMLFRIRNKLKNYLKKEGISLWEERIYWTLLH